MLNATGRNSFGCKEYSIQLFASSPGLNC